MDLIEKTMNQKRHPWELSRTEMIIRLYKRYAEKMRGVMVADIGAGDCFFDCQLVTVDSHIEKIIAIDINYREAPAVDSRIILKNNISELDADSIDVIFMMDVLEHVFNDGAFLREVASKVKSDGLIVITVPAYPSLFSSHDRFLKHYRRYTHERLRKLIECNELQILSHHYFYLSLWIVRWLQVNIGLFGTKSDTGIGTWPYSSSNFVTKIVKHALNLDFLMNEIVHKFGISIPGLSLLAVCKKN